MSSCNNIKDNINALKLLIQNNDSTKLKTYLKDNNIIYSSNIENIKNNCGGNNTMVGINIIDNSECANALMSTCSKLFTDPKLINKCARLKVSGNINQENKAKITSSCYITSLLNDKQLVSNRNINLGLHLVNSNQDLDCKTITNDKILNNINECINSNSILQQNILEVCSMSNISQINNADAISKCIITNVDTSTPTPTPTPAQIIIPTPVSSSSTKTPVKYILMSICVVLFLLFTILGISNHTFFIFDFIIIIIFILLYIFYK